MSHLAVILTRFCMHSACCTCLVDFSLSIAYDYVYRIDRNDMSNDKKNAVKRASYRLSFKAVKGANGTYTVSTIHRDGKGNQVSIDKKDNTLKVFLDSIFGKAVEDTLTSFINDDDGRINETVKAMFDIAGIGIDRPGKAHNHDLDWFQHCETPEAKAEAIGNLEAFTDCLPDVLRQVSIEPIYGNPAYDSNETREAELVAPIHILERTRQRDLMEDLILTARDRIHSMANEVDRRRYARWFMGHLIGGSLSFISHKHDDPDRLDDGTGNLCTPDSAFMADFMIGAMDTPDWYGDWVLTALLLNITNVSSDSIEDLLDPDNVLAFEKLENCKVNIGFALATRPSSIDLTTALSMLPKMKTRVEDWIGKDEYVDTHSPVFETWDVLTHDWDETIMFNVPKIRYYSHDKYSMVPIAYGQAAVRMLEDRKVDPDKVVGLFRSIVPDPIQGDSEVTEFRRRFSQTVIHKLWDIMASVYYLSVNTADGGYMRAMVWLVNLYAGLLDHSPVEIYHTSEDGKADLAYYRFPKLTSDMLLKIVEYYDDGMPMSFIMETILASIAAEDDDKLYCYEDVHIENLKGDSPFARKDPACNEVYLISSNGNTEEDLC